MSQSVPPINPPQPRRRRLARFAALALCSAGLALLPAHVPAGQARSSGPAASPRAIPRPPVTGTPGTTPTPRPSRTATSTAMATATPTPSATPTASATAPTFPPVATAYPTPVRGQTSSGPSYLVGAYYFGGWSHGETNNLSPLLTHSPLRKFEPLIGWYDDSQAQVDRSIDQAAGAGVEFFAFDWYNLARDRYNTDRSLNEGLKYYLTSRHRSRLKFCLNFIDQAPFIPSAREWPSIVQIWITHYFRQPDYVRVNGKPLLIIFSPEHMRQLFGGSLNVHRALDYLRAAARRAGLPGVTIAVGATVTPHANPYHTIQFRQEGYDVTTGYNYHAIGAEKYRTPAPYSALMQENEQMWTRVATTLPEPYIPVITMGWDQRFSVREQRTAIVYAGRTPAQFTCYAAAARRWIDANAQRTVAERIVMVFAWNEIGEGGALIPNKTDGYAYGNAIRRVFGAPGQPPGPLPAC